MEFFQLAEKTKKVLESKEWTLEELQEQYPEIATFALNNNIIVIIKSINYIKIAQ
jgi:hypothetical protein